MAKDVAMPNDVGAWGDKDTRGAWPASMEIAGEHVKMDELPKFGEDGSPAAKTSGAVGARVPLRT